MKRAFVVAFIVCYIGVLTFGNVCHVLRHGTTSHSLMYLIVWDMFSEWSAYDSRVHIIAEGESEAFFELAPAPWGEMHLFSRVGRENFDALSNYSGVMALNVLKHTSHEPISRILVIQESWPKTLNLPDSVWKLRYDFPKDHLSYYRIRQVMLPDGTTTQRYNSFLDYQSWRLATDNPRLAQQSNAATATFLYDGRVANSREHLTGLSSAMIPAPGPSAN